MKRLLLLWVVIAFAAAAVAADENTTAKQSKAKDRLQAAADVLNEIQSAPDQGIPAEVLGSAECVAVVPSMLKGDLSLEPATAADVASCRTPKGLECAGVFQRERRKFWAADRWPGGRFGHADYE